MANAVSYIFKNFDSKFLKKSEPFNEYVQKMTLELEDLTASNAVLDVKLEKEGSDFSVSLNILGLEQPIYINKKSRLALTALKKCRNIAFRKVKKVMSKRHNHYHFLPNQKTI